MSAAIDRVIAKVLAVYGSWRRDTPPAKMRADWDQLFGSEVGEISTTSIQGVECAWIGAPELRRDRLFIYLHGGGYQVGSIRSHKKMVEQLSVRSGLPGLALNYALAPEHRFPVALEECVAVYRHLLSLGIPAGNIALVGDSAGGNLALATVVHLKANGLPLPAAIGLMSPWTDLEAKGESYETRAQSDPIHQRPMILAMASNYLGSADPADPLASPINADLSGFPPVFIQVGDRETVLDDSRNFAERLTKFGVDHECQVWDGMIHVFQQFDEELVEAGKALDAMADFLNKRIGTTIV